MKAIHVVCCCDDGMAIPACVVAASVAATTTDARVSFHILRPPSLSTDLAAAKRRLDSDTFQLVDHVVTEDPQGVPLTRQFTVAAWYRFVVPRHVEADRVVYLDCDTMVRRSLLALHDHDLEGLPIAACRDYTLLHHTRGNGMPVRHTGRWLSVDAYCKDVLAVDLATTPYFNTGVLVMDLAAWEHERISERCLDFARRNQEFVMADQDAANHVIQGRFAPLDPRWNAFTYLHGEYFPPTSGFRQDIFGGYGEHLGPPEGEWSEVLQAWHDDPWIVHFAFKSKPWLFDHRRTDFDAEYWRRAAATPFERQLRDVFDASRRRARLRSLPRFVSDVVKRRRGPLRRRAKPPFYA